MQNVVSPVFRLLYNKFTTFFFLFSFRFRNIIRIDVSYLSDHFCQFVEMCWRWSIRSSNRSVSLELKIELNDHKWKTKKIKDLSLMPWWWSRGRSCCNDLSSVINPPNCTIILGNAVVRNILLSKRECFTFERTCVLVSFPPPSSLESD